MSGFGNLLFGFERRAGARRGRLGQQGCESGNACGTAGGEWNDLCSLFSNKHRMLTKF
jgi:hypothetical protein